MSLKHLEDVLTRPLQDALTRSIEDVLRTHDQDRYIGLNQDTLRMSSEDV